MGLNCSRDYVGAVRDPETGDTIQLNSDIPPDVANRLAKEYAFLTLDEDGVEDEVEESDEPVCGVNGCSRTVDSPEATCWQH